MKKVFLILFSLIMMCSVSFCIEANKEYVINEDTGTSSGSNKIGNYTPKTIYTILKNFSSDKTNEDYKNELNLLISEVKSLGHKYVVFYNSEKNMYYLLINNINHDIDFFIKDGLIGLLYEDGCQGSLNYGYLYGYSSSYCTYYSDSSASIPLYHGYCYAAGIIPSVTSIYDSNTDIYNLSLGTQEHYWSQAIYYYWDGSSYYYKLLEQGGDSEENIPELTDEQIAEIVERFINSDAYLENAYYNGDYFITYDNLTGYFRGYSYSWNIDLAIEYGNYDEEGNFVTTGTKDGEAWRIRPYEFSGDIFTKFGDWLASKFNTYSFEYFSIFPDSSIKPRYIGSLEHNYCSNYKENEVVIYSSKQIRYVGEETNSEGKTETVVTDNYIPPTVLVDSVTGEEIIIRDNLQESSDSLETVITPNADFSGLKEAFEKYISFIDISSITWLTTAISSMITVFVPFVALGIIIFLINRILNGGS